ncbi:MAG: class I SAM-dependent methyltransferase [Thermoguttaceae bacterium]
MNTLAKIWREIKRPFRGQVESKASNVDRRLSATDWGQRYNLEHLAGLVERIRNKKYSAWTEEMLKICKHGDRVLEIGSGTGETSLCLAQFGCECTALDFEQKCLELTDIASNKLAVSVRTVLADCEKELPFSADSFDWVFQAGLLEHFERDKRIELLRNWSRVTRQMVSMIPNASSLAYRAGKAIQEQSGTWPWGLELPQYSLREEFTASGFRVTAEYTIDELHALTFLPEQHYLRTAIERWFRENKCSDNCGQGYLLVTIGKKSEHEA